MNLTLLLHVKLSPKNIHISSIFSILQVKDLVKRANIITKIFKHSTLASFQLEEAIKTKNIQGGGLKTYVKTKWTTVFKCTNSI